MYGAQEQSVVVTGHDIIVRGEESVKNILHKTLVAMRYCFECKDYKFDYVIRSCISTVFNFGKLPISDFINKDYASSLVLAYDPEKFPDSLGRPYVAIDQQPYIGIKFASGSNIFLSKSAALHLLDCETSMAWNLPLPDDVAIAEILAGNYTVEILCSRIKAYRSNEKFPQEKIYRFRSQNRTRDQDADNMGKLVDKLLEVIECQETKGSKRKSKLSVEWNDYCREKSDFGSGVTHEKDLRKGGEGVVEKGGRGSPR